MKLAFAFFLALVLAPVTLHAQYEKPAAPSFGVAGMEGIGSTKAYTVEPSACPMALRAQHMAGGGMVTTGRVQNQVIPSNEIARTPSGPDQRLHLTLNNNKDSAIVSAQVIVHGWTAHGKLEKAAPAAKSPATATRTLTAHFTPGENNTVSAEIVAPNLTAVTSIELASTTYADGSVWTPGNGNTCRVTPDMLMRIGNR